jgi:DNA-binding response OmpR family regulator
MNEPVLSGRRIIILEDDYFQANDCKQMLEQAGASVILVSAWVPDLSSLGQEGPIDAALIDVNLGQELSFDFARKLRDQGIPFVFLTGYDAAILPEDLVGSAWISKPAAGAQVLALLAGKPI